MVIVDNQVVCDIRRKEEKPTKIMKTYSKTNRMCVNAAGLWYSCNGIV